MNTLAVFIVIRILKIIQISSLYCRQNLKDLFSELGPKVAGNKSLSPLGEKIASWEILFKLLLKLSSKVRWVKKMF